MKEAVAYRCELLSHTTVFIFTTEYRRGLSWLGQKVRLRCVQGTR